MDEILNRFGLGDLAECFGDDFLDLDSKYIKLAIEKFVENPFLANLVNKEAIKLKSKTVRPSVRTNVLEPITVNVHNTRLRTKSNGTAQESSNDENAPMISKAKPTKNGRGRLKRARQSATKVVDGQERDENAIPNRQKDQESAGGSSASKRNAEVEGEQESETSHLDDETSHPDDEATGGLNEAERVENQNAADQVPVVKKSRNSKKWKEGQDKRKHLRYFDLYEDLPPYEEMPDANAEREKFYDKCIEIVTRQKEILSAMEWEGAAVAMAFKYPILVESFYSGVAGFKKKMAGRSRNNRNLKKSKPT